MLPSKLKAIAQSVGLIGVIFLAIQGFFSLASGEKFLLIAEAQEQFQPNSSVPIISIPRHIIYQGSLLFDSNGNPLDGTFDMVFRIYDDLNLIEDNPIYTESIDRVTIQNGSFAVLLGDSVPLPDTIFTHVDADDQLLSNYYINASVITEEGEFELGDQRFTSVAYAFNADLLDNKDATEFSSYNAIRTGPSFDSPSGVFVNEDGMVGFGTEDPEDNYHFQWDAIPGQQRADLLLQVDEHPWLRLWATDPNGGAGITYSGEQPFSINTGDGENGIPRVSVHQNGGVEIDGALGINTAPDLGVALSVEGETQLSE